jgi:hypothetical protein
MPQPHHEPVPEERADILKVRPQGALFNDKKKVLGAMIGHGTPAFTSVVRGAGVRAVISGDLLSAVISIRYILGFRKDNPNVFNNLIQNWPHF